MPHADDTLHCLLPALLKALVNEIIDQVGCSLLCSAAVCTQQLALLEVMGELLTFGDTFFTLRVLTNSPSACHLCHLKFLGTSRPDLWHRKYPAECRCMFMAQQQMLLFCKGVIRQAGKPDLLFMDCRCISNRKFRGSSPCGPLGPSQRWHRAQDVNRASCSILQTLIVLVLHQANRMIFIELEDFGLAAEHVPSNC
jgi:hypothetical protein